MKGRTRSTAHPHGTEAKVERAHMDYFFLSREHEEGKATPMVVVKDDITGNKVTIMAENKGVLEKDWLVEELAEEIKRWCHAWNEDETVTFKSDGEPSIMALKYRLMGELNGEKTRRDCRARTETL